MLDIDPPALRWVKAEASNRSGECVEVAALADGGVAVRHSHRPEGPLLVYTGGEFAAFLAGAKQGEFDHLVARSPTEQA